MLSTAASPLFHLTLSSHIITYSIPSYLYSYFKFKCYPDIPILRPDKVNHHLLQLLWRLWRWWHGSRNSSLCSQGTIQYNTIQYCLKEAVYSPFLFCILLFLKKIRKSITRIKSVHQIDFYYFASRIIVILLYSKKYFLFVLHIFLKTVRLECVFRRITGCPGGNHGFWFRCYFRQNERKRAICQTWC